VPLPAATSAAATATPTAATARQQHELTKHFSREILHKPSARGSGKSEKPSCQSDDSRQATK